MNCIICNNRRLILRQKVPACEIDYRIYHCANCGVEFALPRRVPRNFYANRDHLYYLKAFVDGHQRPHVKRLQRYLIPDRTRSCRHWIRNHVAPDQPILDIGCGTADFLRDLQMGGFRNLHGLDAAGDVIARNRDALPGIAFYHELLEEFLNIPQKFSVITMFEVLEHLTAPAATLQKLAERLNPGGCLVLSVPDRDNVLAKGLQRLLGHRELTEYPPHHLTWWNEEAFGNLFVELDFEVLEFWKIPFDAMVLSLAAAPNASIRGRLAWIQDISGRLLDISPDGFLWMAGMIKSGLWPLTALGRLLGWSGMSMIAVVRPKP